LRGILEPHKMNKPAFYSPQVWGPWCNSCTFFLLSLLLETRVA